MKYELNMNKTIGATKRNTWTNMSAKRSGNKASRVCHDQTIALPALRRQVVVGIWRIIPLSKLLITVVNKSPKKGCFPSKWFKWLIHGVYELLTKRDDPPSTHRADLVRNSSKVLKITRANTNPTWQAGMAEKTGDLNFFFCCVLFVYKRVLKRMVKPTAIKSHGNQQNSNFNLFFLPKFSGRWRANSFIHENIISENL